nr:DUF4861 family protein [Melioribacteraceae bacterium]
ALVLVTTIRAQVDADTRYFNEITISVQNPTNIERIDDLIEQGEDELNYFVSLSPNKNKVQYAFAAAWELEKDGIKNKDEFESYIDNEITKLNNPLEIEIQ